MTAPSEAQYAHTEAGSFCIQSRLEQSSKYRHPGRKHRRLHPVSTRSSPQLGHDALQCAGASFIVTVRGSEPSPSEIGSAGKTWDSPWGASESRFWGFPMIRSAFLLFAFLCLTCAARAMLTDIDDRDSLVVGFVTIASICICIGFILGH